MQAHDAVGAPGRHPEAHHRDGRGVGGEDRVRVFDDLVESRNVAVSSVLNAGHQGGEALAPVLIGVVIDQAVSTGDTSSLLQWIGALAAVYIGLSFSFRFGARAGERAAEEAGHTLRVELTGRVLDPRGGAETGRLPGALTNIATEDARRVGAVSLALPLGIAALIALLVTTVALLALYGGLKVAKEQREVYVKEAGQYGTATSFVSALSVPYLLDRLVPQLSAAVDGDVKTKVEQPAS
ncbi:ABC transporter transmembrane domain-containing protein [Streptomyces sp. H27-D2]|uniref:ABC transporter transmembrane domain-containing protein n=1 Tax=Streptomyces sp. H27-D2 TaxID=3046304 RepID=UPI003FA6DE7F